MKKNIAFYQQAIMNELIKEYTTRDLANFLLNELDENGISVYSSDSNGITVRNNDNVNITDNKIIKCLTKAIRIMINNSADMIDILSDVYDCKYSDKYINDSFVSTIITISRSGRLIHLDLDI